MSSGNSEKRQIKAVIISLLRGLELHEFPGTMDILISTDIQPSVSRFNYLIIFSSTKPVSQ